MKKMIVFVIILALMMPVMVSPAFAATKINANIVNVGNKLCPVSGDPVSGHNFVVYQGKRYGLCCPKCRKPFLADPEKYIAQMEAKEKVPASAATATPVIPKSDIVPIIPEKKQ
jgi:YHS domain-containing protein